MHTVVQNGTSLTNETVVFGLGTRLHVRMRTTFENGVLHNGQLPGGTVKQFYQLVTMKTLSGCKLRAIISSRQLEACLVIALPEANLRDI